MTHQILLQLAGIAVLGILAQWLAWGVRLPSILLLLATGILAGPIGGLIDPDKLFGELLLPMVSLSVAVILYEGGLNLKLRDLHEIGGTFFLIITVGAAITWITGTIAAHFILELRWPVATLLGAILVVTGPTVVGPILRHLRLRGRVSALLNWEGIIIDPLGAALAVLVFSVVRAEVQDGYSHALMAVGLTLAVGIVAGCVMAGVLILAFSRFWIPDFLHNPVSLMLMFVAFTTANVVQQEAGLLAVTLMGMVVANQRWVSVHHVVRFKETITVFLISCLFITLAARLKIEDLLGLGWHSFAFVLIMLIVARPLSVLAATWRSSLTWQERCFLSCMAPRGIVAAAIASTFALDLVTAGYPRAVEIVPITFLMVFMPALIYGVSAAPLAQRLGLTQVNPQGIVFVGAESWVRALALAVKQEGYQVVLIDTNWENCRQARMLGLPCLHGSALAEKIRDEIDYSGISKMLAVTSNDEVNSLACLRYAEEFGKQEVYQLPFSSIMHGRREAVSQEHQGRLLFDQHLTFMALTQLVGKEPSVKKTKLTPEFDFKSFQTQHGNALLPLLVIKSDGTVQVRTVDGLLDPKPGDSIVSFVLGVSDKSSDQPQCDADTHRAPYNSGGKAGGSRA